MSIKDLDLCPCHSGLCYSLCCGPFHKEKNAETAMQLMRSRYAAYALGLVSYIQNTETKPSSRKSLEEFCRSTKLQGLIILSFTEDSVTFVVHTTKGSWQEESHFVRKGGRLLYVSR